MCALRSIWSRFHSPRARSREKSIHCHTCNTVWYRLPVEKNEIAQDIITKSRDYSLVRRLHEDTEENRQLYFAQSIEELAVFIENFTPIKQVILPWEIEMSCTRRNEKCESEFLPIIQNFQKRLQPCSVKVILVCSDKKRIEEEEEEEEAAQKRELISNSPMKIYMCYPPPPPQPYTLMKHYASVYYLRRVTGPLGLLLHRLCASQPGCLHCDGQHHGGRFMV